MTAITITNNTNSKVFLFNLASGFNDKTFQPSIDVPFIGNTPANRLIFKFTGQANDIVFDFTLFEDGTDFSNGTHTSTIETVPEQVQYLKEEIYDPAFDTDFTMSAQDGIVISGVIENLEFSTPIGGVIRNGTLTFKQGSLVGPI